MEKILLPLRVWVALVGIILFSSGLFSQVNCSGDTPFFTVDLTGNPAGMWVSPAVARNGSCCEGGANQVNCIELSITLDPAAEGIIFAVESGANPGGSLYYQINCQDVPVASGSAAICLDGAGPHLISYCKVGNNTNTYSITSVPGPVSSGDVITADGCADTLSISGLEPSTITWNSIFPGAPGDYNSYLNNLGGSNAGATGVTYTGEETVVVTPQPGFPSEIQYEVCGDVLGSCSIGSFCDTVSVFIYPTLFADINPDDPAICFGAAGVNLSAVPIGGTAPYSYVWYGPSNNGATTQNVFATTPGNYTVEISDATGCPAAVSTITVTQFSNPITADAGTDFTICGTPAPTLQLNGVVTGVTTGIWSGGTGTYVNGDTSLDLQYIPSAAEIAAGSVTLTLSTTNNLTCPGDQDAITITLSQFDSNVVLDVTDVSCFGLSDGAIDMTITGGASPYSFFWAGGETTEDISGLGTGTYSVVVTDVYGCEYATQTDVIQPPVLTESVSAITYAGGWNVSCNGATDGAVDLVIGGGTPPYTYAWSNGATTEDLSNVGAGTYSVTVTDANGCVISTAITLTEPPVMTESVSAITYAGGWNVSCNGANDGSVDLVIGGGTPGYTYSWDNGDVTEDLSGISAGTYSVSVTDANGCVINSSITLTEPPVLSEGISATTYGGGWNITCNGASNGAINLTVAGGTPGYTYAWSNGAVTEDINSIPAGTYSVVVTDANGCTIPSSITLQEPPVLTESVSAITYAGGWNVSCNGATDGAVDLVIGGGTPPYTYAWDNGATTEDLSNVGAGTYTVTVTDANGCVISTTITLTEPPVLTASLTPSVYAGGGNTSGCVDDGFIDLTVAGGTLPYTYSWNNGEVTEDLSGLGVGNYLVTVTDANGCIITDAVSLISPDAVSANISAGTYVGGWNVSCNGASDGSIDVTPFNGAAPYTYLWNTGATTEDLSGVPAGTYMVTVTDANGCEYETSIVLIEPPVLTENVTAATYAGGWNVSCNGASDGSVDLTIGGGTPGYTYVWNNGATTEDLSNVSAGTYTLTATDANGCTVTSSITLTEPPVLTENATAATYAGGWNVSCNGASDGSVDLTIGGGTPGYTYVWNNGATTEDLSNVSAGTYTLTATDANGCTVTSSITLTEPPVLTENATAATYAGGWNVSCNGASDGSVDLTIGGGTPGYTYAWSNGAITEDLSGVSAGTYTVTVTDANGCVITSSITLTEPPILTENSTAAVFPGGWNVSCNGASDGSVDLTIGGGTPGYTYVWDNGAGTEDLSGVSAGTYNVTVTDANGCVIISSVSLTEPPVITETMTATIFTGGWNVSCNGASDGSIDLSVNGGTPGYTYSWDNGAVTEDLSGVPVGAYSVVITDVNGCTLPGSITLSEPPVITVLAQVVSDYNGEDISCAGASDGVVMATVNGGTPGYVYVWTDAGGNVVSTLPNAGNLSAGVYTVTIMDQNGCTTSTAVTVQSPAPLNTVSQVTTNYNGEDISCFGASDGGVTSTPSGGVAPYTYEWTNSSNVLVSNTQSASGLLEGLYTVLITDANGCQFADQVTVEEPEELQVNSTVTSDYNGQDISCYNATDGSATVVVAGGTGPFTYMWIDAGGQSVGSTQSVSGLGAGTYTVVVTDANGCQSTSTVVLSDPGPLFTDINTLTDYFGMPVSCENNEDGTIEVVFGGGTPTYTIVWHNPPGNNSSLSGLGVGQYDVTIFDANGCQVSDNIILDAHPVPEISLSTPHRVCLGDEVEISCATDSDNTVLWTFSNGLTSSSCAPGTITANWLGCIDAEVEAISSFGCVTTQMVSDYICVEPLPNPNFSSTPKDPSFITPSVYFTNLSSGAEAYQWSFGDGSEDSNLENVQHLFPDHGPGEYLVTLVATSAYGCIDSITMPVTIGNELIFYVPNAFTPDGKGVNEVFMPVFYSGYDPYDYTLLIFNRWGEVLFESHNTEVGWNGTYGGVEVEDGVYIWKIMVGDLQNAQRVEQIGHVTLLR